MDKLAKMFMKKAEGDLSSAKILLEAERYSDAAYHSQQAAETAVKALLILNKVDVREHIVSQHFVRNIGQLLPPTDEKILGKIIEALVRLEQHWIKPRYPYITSRFEWDPEVGYTLDKAAEAVKTGEFVISQIKKWGQELFAFEL